MSDEITLSMRPRTFSDMVGAKRLLRQIRKIVESGKVPKAWIFSGETGSGKTTLARIMAASLQCRHQKEFGDPCRRCYKHRSEFDILEIDGAKLTGKEAVEDATSGYLYAPKPGSRRRVYILDEAHMMSASAQNLLLKPFEDCPHTTNWIICTTRPDKILSTLQSRCTILPVPSLELEGVKELVKRGLKLCHSDRSSSELAEKLLENRITSPRLILKAVQKFVDPESTAEEAAQVALAGNIDTYTVCRSVVKGDWEAVARIMALAKDDDNVVIRATVSGYLKAILLGDVTGDRAKYIVRIILELARVGDNMPATCAALYNACKYFKRENR